MPVSSSESTSVARSLFRSLGPAIIVASVVLGPGSILTSSKVGCQYGYSMVWVLLLAAALMVSMVALGARLGVTSEGTLCDELARRLGRPWAVLAGGCVFAIVACFQFSNNLGVLAAIEPFVETSDQGAFGWPSIVLVGLNGVSIAALYGLRHLYRPIEKLMMLLVGLMLVAFAANLFFARPSLFDVLAGCIPRLPAGTAEGLIPFEQDGQVVDPLLPLTGLLATTFSVAAAFYQSSLVREKGWTVDHLRQGLIDSVAGISVLAGISLMIMVTSAAVLYGTVAPASLSSAAEVAKQLEPLFGPSAKVLFCLGIFAGAFSSFLVNALIGGVLLADGLGLGGRMDQPSSRFFTSLALLIGMGVALGVKTSDMSTVNLIIVAQAITVLGVPLLAFSMLYLATTPDRTGPRRIPRWMIVMASLSCLVVVVVAARTAWRIVLQLT